MPLRKQLSISVAASAFSVAVIGAGCGAEFDRERAVESFKVTNPNATDTQAACVVDHLLDRYTIEEMEAELAAPVLDAAFEEAQFRDMFTCGLEGDLRTQIIDQLESTGVDHGDAPCVADGMLEKLDDADIDVLLSGEITESFYGKFFNAMESCGAVDGVTK